MICATISDKKLLIVSTIIKELILSEDLYLRILKAIEEFQQKNKVESKLNPTDMIRNLLKNE